MLLGIHLVCLKNKDQVEAEDRVHQAFYQYVGNAAAFRLYESSMILRKLDRI